MAILMKILKRLFKKKHALPEGFMSLEDHLKHLEFNRDYEGHYNCTMAFSNSPVMMILSKEIVTFFKETKAVNYVSMRFWDRDNDQQYELIVQKCDGKTPAERVHELEKEINELRGGKC